MDSGQEGGRCLGKCCFCINLKTGIMVFGIISSIICGICLIGAIVILYIIGSTMPSITGVADAVPGNAHKNTHCIQKSKRIRLGLMNDKNSRHIFHLYLQVTELVSGIVTEIVHLQGGIQEVLVI